MIFYLYWDKDKINNPRLWGPGMWLNISSSQAIGRAVRTSSHIDLIKDLDIKTKTKEKCKRCKRIKLRKEDMCYKHIASKRVKEVCGICLENRKMKFLPCIHKICYLCDDKIDICPFCRTNC